MLVDDSYHRTPGDPGRRILVVDDDPRIRQLLLRILETSGFLGTAAADAAEARERLREQRYAAILIDVRMPGESGIDLLKHVTAECVDTAPVMVTASDDHHLVETAFETGAYGYVVKPFRMSELMINITSALHRRDLEMRNRDYIRELEEKVGRHRALHSTIAPLEAAEDPAAAPITTEEVIGRLTAVKGFGRWTAEMFLMFRLHRPDVLPVDDLGIVKAVQKLYRLRKRPTAKRILKIGDAWRPYRSVASWYLWQTLREAENPKLKT